MEKPADYAQLIDQIMSQSGKELVISAGFTARTNHRELRTVVVDAILHARRYSKSQVEKHLKTVGIHEAMKSSGGLPVEWTVLFDKRIPVARQFTDVSTGKTIAMDKLPWDKIDANAQRAIATGVYREPLEHLVNATQ